MGYALFFGIIALIIGFLGSGFNPGFQRYSTVFKFAGFVLVALSIVLSSFIIISPTTAGVQVFLGRIKETVLTEGPNFVVPFTKIDEFDLKTRKITFSSSENDENGNNGGAIEVLSKDGLSVLIDLTLNYKLDPSQVVKIRKELGAGAAYVDVIVTPTARTRIRENAANYFAVELYSDKREIFQSTIFEGIRKDFERRGIILEELLVRNISLPRSVREAIEAKINAEQDAQKMQFVLQREQQEAERKRVEAQGIADYQRIISSTLNDRQLQYEQIKAMQELVKSPNSKVIFMGGKTSGASVLIGDK
ncbi:MAG: prohibitin family protein [Chloroherpetonaceae bacterium]|nr:prohibitin family protein [Chloroherpetonaceae bacterium]